MQVLALKNDEDKQREVVSRTKAATPQILYSQDLESFIAALEEHEARELKQINALEARQKKARGNGRLKKARPPQAYQQDVHRCDLD